MLSKLTFMLATVLLADTCNRQGIEKETLLVKETKADCTGSGPMQCLQVKHETDSAWTLLYNNIEGFDYQEGYRYKIRVKVSPIKDPPADGSSLRYELDKILDKTAVEAADAGAAAGDIQKTLEEKRWVLQQMEGAEQQQSPIWLEFDGAKHRFHGNGGCNSLAGGYEAEGSNISFMQVISTRMACADQAANERESALLRLLTEHTYQLQLEGQTLSFMDNGKAVLQFNAQEKKQADTAPGV